MSGTSNENDLSVANRFRQMNISLGESTATLATPWLQGHNRSFKGFVGGMWISDEWLLKNINVVPECEFLKINSNSTGEHLCDVYTYDSIALTEKVSTLSESGFVEWSTKSAASRSKCLYNVGNTIKKYQELFAIIESISSGNHLSRVKSKDIPRLIESFFYYAGCALQLHESKLWAPLGPVCILKDKYSSPSLALSLQISSLLAAGNSVVVYADVQNCLSAFLLAEICIEAGIPENVLNVLPMSHKSMATLQGFKKILYTGSLKECVFSNLLYTICPPVDVLVPCRPTVIVYESTDLHAAAEGVLEAFFYNNTKSDAGGCKVMIQQSVADVFLKILEEAFSKTVSGHNLSKADMCISTENQNGELLKCLEAADKKAKVFKLPSNETLNDACIPPMIISGVETGFKLVHEELGGPIIVAVTFRTVKESIAMFNCDNKGSPVSIWTEITSVALEVAEKLKTGTVWVNSQNVFDSSVSFSSVCSSGTSVEGGKEAFYSHLKPIQGVTSVAAPSSVKEDYFPKCFDLPANTQNKNMKEYKLYIDGELKNASNGQKCITPRSIISSGSGKDIELAVSYAIAAQPKWEILAKGKKREVLLSMANALEKKTEDFISVLISCDISEDDSKKEVSDSIKTLHHWAFQSDNYDGEVKDVSGNKVLQVRSPLGVIGIQATDSKPLLSFISQLAPAIAFGNAVVALASEKYPEPALKMSEIFGSSGVPKGVINVNSGPSVLMSDMLNHKDIDAVWLGMMPNYNPKRYPLHRVYDFCDVSNYFNDAINLKCVMSCTFIKSIFLPRGEIFAN